jgi:hypothetical protein
LTGSAAWAGAMTVAAPEASTPLRKFLRPVAVPFVSSGFVVVFAKMCLLGC